MSEQPLQWTKSMRVAHSFVQRGVSEGLTATEGLRQFRAGGGAIRDSSWFRLFREDFAHRGVRENVLRIPETYTVPETMFEPKPFDFRGKYVMQMEVSGYSTELEQRITKWVTVESDHLLTKHEWRGHAQTAITGTIGSPIFTVDRVSEWVPLMRAA